MSQLIENYVPVVKFNGGLSTELPVVISSDLTVTGTTNIAGVSLTDLTTTGNTTLGNVVTDTTTINGETDINAATAANGNGLHVSQTPSATGKHNGVKVDITQSAAGDDSNSGVRATITKTTTAAIGNLRSVHAVLDMVAQPTSQGHTAAGYFEGATTDAATNITGIISAVKSGAAGGATTPFLNIIDASTTKSTVVLEAGTGGALGTAVASAAVAFTTGLTVGTINAATTAALKVKINGVDYWIPLATTPV
jgi:hypothetical protein